MSQNSKVEPHLLKRFDLIKKVGSGAYGHVWKVQDRSSKQVLALKKIFDAFQHSTDAQRTYREISILKQLDHDNIIKLKETIKADNGKDIYLVFEYMEADLHNVIAEGILKQVHNKYIIYQVAKALKYLHSAKLIHRDLKPSNVLLNSNCLVKLCDFGLVRCVTSGEDNNSVMTEGVATRWYRAPEVLLGSKSYEYPADVWSFGCIIFEIYLRRPLFNGSSTLQQLQKIIEFVGYPNNDDISSLDSDLAKTMIGETKMQTEREGKMRAVLSELQPDVQDLIQGIMQFNPRKRLTIADILSHPLLKDFRKVDEQKTCSAEIRTDIDDNKKLSVDNYRNLLYKASRSESKRQTPPKVRKPNTATTTQMLASKSDKKIGAMLGTNKSGDNIKPSSALLQSKSGGNILKASKSGQLKNESFQQPAKPLTKTNSTLPTKYDIVQHPHQPMAQKPLASKLVSPTNTSANFTSQKATLASVNSGKIIKTILRKPEKENLTVGLTKTLNITDTMSPKAVLGRKTIHHK